MTTPDQRARRLDDEGAILIIAILVVTAVALVTGVVLTQGNGSLRAAVKLRDVARQSYTAEAATQVAVNALRTGYRLDQPNTPWYYTNAENTGCFGPNATNASPGTLPMNGLIPQITSLDDKGRAETQSTMSAVVVCEPENDTGERGLAVPVSSSNKPGYAVVALAGDVDATGSKAPGLLVRGGIYANGSVKGLVNVIAGGVRATGSCDATVTASPKLCGGGVTPVPDPNYSSELGNTVPDLRTPPTSCTSGVAIFEPGYYDNAKKLNAATNLCSTAWFKPGDYYFDFHDQACANVCPDNVFDASSNVWTISGKTVVGGTPVDANGNNLAQLPSGATVPGACRNPITNVNTKGVQFVFGGSSRIYIDQKSDVELCATYHPDRPPIAIYGLKSGQTPTATAATGLTLGTVQASGSFGGTATPTSLAPGGSVASWTTSNANAQTTTLTVKGFTPGGATPPPVPGAILQSAKLRITHKDADGTANSASSAKLTIGSSTTAAIAVPASVSTTTTELVFDGSTNAAIFNSLQTEVHDNGFGNVAVAYTANAKKLNGVTEVDAITFDLTYYLPVLRSQVGTCIDGTAPACLFLDMKNGNNMTKAYVQGTTYVPKGDLQMLLGNAASEIMKFGVVARQVSLQFWNGNSSQTDPVIEVPSDSPGFGFETTLVRLSVYVCSGSTCSVDPANLALRSRVKIFDEGGTPGPGHRQMSILNWDHTR